MEEENPEDSYSCHSFRNCGTLCGLATYEVLLYQDGSSSTVFTGAAKFTLSSYCVPLSMVCFRTVKWGSSGEY